MKRNYYSEKWLEDKLVEETELLGGKAPKFVSPGNRGVPDRLVLTKPGRARFVELKSTGQTLDPLQLYWQRVLLSLGFDHYVVDDKDSLDKLLDDLKHTLK